MYFSDLKLSLRHTYFYVRSASFVRTPTVQANAAKIFSLQVLHWTKWYISTYFIVLMRGGLGWGTDRTLFWINRRTVRKLQSLTVYTCQNPWFWAPHAYICWVHFLSTQYIQPWGCLEKEYSHIKHIYEHIYISLNM